jgi:hypothetical protein
VQRQCCGRWTAKASGYSPVLRADVELGIPAVAPGHRPFQVNRLSSNAGSHIRACGAEEVFAVPNLLTIFTFKRFVFYAFPIYLVLAEYAIRFLMSFAPGRGEEVSLIAASNSVAAAGLSLVAPVLIPKPVTVRLSQATLDALRAQGADLINRHDRALIFSGYIGLLVLPFPWGLSLWYAHDSGTPHVVMLLGWPIPMSLLIALGIYIVGMIYTEVKEKA